MTGQRLDVISEFGEVRVTADGEDSGNLGPLVAIVRVLRSGQWMVDIMPEMVAEMTLAAIPSREPDTARARLVRVVQTWG